MKRNTYILKARPSAPLGVRWKRIFLGIALLLAIPKLIVLAAAHLTEEQTPLVSAALEDVSRIELVAMKLKKPDMAEGVSDVVPRSLSTDPAVPGQPREIEDVAEADSVLEKNVRVARGDTLMGILLDAGLARNEAHAAVSALQEVYDPRSLRPGHEVVLRFVAVAENEAEDEYFSGLRMQVDVDRNVLVLREGEEEFQATEEHWELQSAPFAARGEITSSLYNAADHAGMPNSVLIQMIRAFSFDIDFQRDVHPGDRFEALFERELDRQGQAVRDGALRYATLETSGRTLRIFRYTALDGETDFFNAQGQSVRKSLMLTPIDGARISSGYGMRRHPILGYNRMHRGLDFAAPTGTPIMAAGNGVVTYAGRKGNYGITVELRHPNGYTTLYAHMSRLGRGINRGARVTQGQVIGYVGSTGMSTGPHLHYEVRHRGQHVNPTSVDTPPGRTLTGEDLELFRVKSEQLRTQYAALIGNMAADAAEKDTGSRVE